MRTATKPKPKPRTTDRPTLHSEYHKANARALERSQAIQSGEPDPGPLMTLDDDDRVGQPINGTRGKLARGPRAVGLDDSTHPTTLSDDEMLAARGMIELIPIEHLGASPYQPRLGYDETTINELAASMKAAGRNHTDLIVRLITATSVVSTRARGRVLPKTKYEVLDGHRRLLAGQKAGLSALWCKVVELDDAAARKLCREANLNREDLKPLERLYALRDMRADGDYATDAELAASLGITPAALSNQLRILKLPHEILDLISQEIIKPTHLRSLVEWENRPAILQTVREDVLARVKRDGKADPYRPSCADFERLAERAVTAATRPMKATGGHVDNGKHSRWVGADEMPTAATLAKHRAELDVVKVPHVGERCFNLKLWDELQAARAKEVAGRLDGGSKKKKSAGGGQPTKAEVAEREKAKAEQLHKRLYRYRLGWLQRAVVERIGKASAATLLQHVLLWAAAGGSQFGDQREQEFGDAVIDCGGTQKAGRRGYTERTDVWASLATLAKHADGLDLAGLARATLAKWYGHTFEGYSTDLPPEFLEAAATDLEIDFAKEWTLDAEFVELFTSEQLKSLCDDWGLSIMTELPKKRSDLLAFILARKDRCKQFPKCLSKLKPVSLL